MFRFVWNLKHKRIGGFWIHFYNKNSHFLNGMSLKSCLKFYNFGILGLRDFKFSWSPLHPHTQAWYPSFQLFTEGDKVIFRNWNLKIPFEQLTHFSTYEVEISYLTQCHPYEQHLPIRNHIFSNLVCMMPRGTCYLCDFLSMGD